MQPKIDLNQYAGKKVAVAMSGGVDSSVAAYLLKEAGAEVFGISMTTVPGSTCCSIKDITEAGEVAKQLGIEHKVISLRELFEKEAIQLQPEELSEVWGMIEKHIELEKETVRLAEESRKNSNNFVVRYLLGYLMTDEQKHNEVLAQLEDVKRGMYPYSG